MFWYCLHQGHVHLRVLWKLSLCQGGRKVSAGDQRCKPCKPPCLAAGATPSSSKGSPCVAEAKSLATQARYVSGEDWPFLWPGMTLKKGKKRKKPVKVPSLLLFGAACAHVCNAQIRQPTLIKEMIVTSLLGKWASAVSTNDWKSPPYAYTTLWRCVGLYIVPGHGL